MTGAQQPHDQHGRLPSCPSFESVGEFTPRRWQPRPRVWPAMAMHLKRPAFEVECAKERLQDAGQQAGGGE